MMLQLSGSKIGSLPLGPLTWKRDLLYFEGPLLSEFVSNKGEAYLKYWCDCDDNYNRWMLLKVKEQDRLRLVLGEKSLYQVIVNQPDCFVFISDEGDNDDYHTLVESSQIPDSYLPEENSYLDIKEYIEDENIISLVFEERWEFEDLDQIYRKLTQIYNFIFVSNNKGQRLGLSMPWQGGFSSVHFYNRLKKIIPANSTSSLDSIHYASPGYMKMSMDSAIANIALGAINSYGSNKHNVDSLFSALEKRIRELELNKLSPNSAVNTFESDSDCTNDFKLLVESLSGFNMPWLLQFVETDFERCKIVMAHVRRLKYFQKYLKNGSVRVVSSVITSP